MTIVREAHAGDAAAIDAIFRVRPGAPNNADNTADFARRIAEQRHPFGFWVAEQGGHVLGWISVQPMRNNPALRDTMGEVSLYVSPASQRRGIGRTLVAHVVERADAPMEWLVAFVAEPNASARRVFDHRGFEPFGVVPVTCGAIARPRVLILGLEVSRPVTVQAGAEGHQGCAPSHTRRPGGVR